jgi:hypothetical protein
MHNDTDGYADSTFDITWTPDTDPSGLITLNLGLGPSSNIEIAFSIALDIANSGVYFPSK